MSRLLSRAVCSILGALGLIPGLGCVIDKNGPMEYGTFHADYLLDGIVVETSTGQPIKGIAVKFDDLHLLSDEGGKWFIGDTAFPCTGHCTLEAKDIDGELNGGSFKTAVVPLDPRQTKQGNGDWYKGASAQHDIVVRLEKLP